LIAHAIFAAAVQNHFGPDYSGSLSVRMRSRPPLQIPERGRTPPLFSFQDNIKSAIVEIFMAIGAIACLCLRTIRRGAWGSTAVEYSPALSSPRLFSERRGHNQEPLEMYFAQARLPEIGHTFGFLPFPLSAS
jgi:hypothetical protein